MAEAYRGIAAAALLALLASCAHDVTLLDGSDAAGQSPGAPVGLTVAIFPGSFERCRLEPEGVVHRFAAALREARLFQGVMYPVPQGATARWEIELVASDEALEPASNRWKGAVASLLLPAAFVVKLQNDYHLRLEALLLKEGVLVGSYGGEARIRHRFGPYANRSAANAEGVELAVGTAARAVLARMSEDLGRIDRENGRHATDRGAAGALR